MADIKVTFSGSIPDYYDTCLGPAWFDPHAADLAGRLPSRPRGDVLEIACGTGRVTRHVRERVDADVRMVATDLSPAMLAYARGKLSHHPNIEWREADAMRLPFGDEAFGAVVCAFGFMFVPDKPMAFAEARRVLRKGGLLLFNVWDRIEENRHGAINARVIEGLFPGDPEMRFRVPYELADRDALRRLVADAGFGDIRMETKRIPVDRVSARTVATGLLRGTPRSLLIEQRGLALDDVIDQVTEALAQQGGADPYRGTSQAIVVQATA